MHSPRGFVTNFWMASRAGHPFWEYLIRNDANSHLLQKHDARFPPNKDLRNWETEVIA